jgi:hypothetical protein
LAYEYARRAAQAQLPTAEFAMGYFNEIGMHVPVNLEKALEWYEKAAKNGNADATARIESISKSRTLSKTDHEKVAINKIKSTHGSMRGQRPARLQQKLAAPPLPTVSDSGEYGEPDRGASTTPYPISDQPPVVSNAPPPAPYDRPATAAPYPLDNGPPRVGSARPPMAGGFAPELRPASARPEPRTSSSSAFNINPNIYASPNDTYGRGQHSPHGPGNLGPLPLRPHTSVDNMGQGRGWVPSGGRSPSGGLPPPQPGGYRQPGGPPEQRPSTVQPADIGFVAPETRNRLQKQPGPGPMKKQPNVPDMGHAPSPMDSRQHTRPSTAQPGMEGRSSSRPDRPSTAAPGPGPGPGAGGPGRRDPTPQQGANMTRPKPSPSPQAPPKQQAQAPSAKPGGPKPQAAKPAAPSTPGKGPKTFDEMGIGQAPKENDCVSAILTSAIRTIHATNA